MSPTAHPAGSHTAPAIAAAPLSQNAIANTGTVGMFTRGPISDTCPNVTQMIGSAATHAASDSDATSSSTLGTAPAAPALAATHASPYRIQGPNTMSPAVEATLSWNPASRASRGCAAVITMAAAASAASPLRGRPSQNPMSTMSAMIPARTTVSSAPARNTYSTREAVAGSVAQLRPTSGTNSRNASAVTSAMFEPETATKCASPVSRNASVSSRGIVPSRPITMPDPSAAAGSGSAACIERSSRKRISAASARGPLPAPSPVCSTCGKLIVPTMSRRARKAR